MIDTLIQDWQKFLAVVPDKLDMFRRAARDLGKEVAQGRREKPKVVDDLVLMARAHKFFGFDDEEGIEAVIAEGLSLGERDHEDAAARESEVPADSFAKLCAEADEKAARARKGNGADRSTRPMLQRLDQFLAEFVPPDYLIDGLVQRGFVYSLTGKTGSGKSAIGLLLALLVAADVPSVPTFGGHPVERGRVVYIAKENATDIMMRLKAMCFAYGLDPGIIGPKFLVVQRIKSIDEQWAQVQAELLAGENAGPVTLIVVDTSVSLYPATGDENATIQMYQHALRLRSLTGTRGNPCVLALCHPGKNPNSADELLPRGGGAFLNEMDGNLSLWSTGERISELHWRGKLRGPGFEPMTFRMRTIACEDVRDSKGRILPTVMAEHIGADEALEIQAAGDLNDERLLVAMQEKPGGSLAAWALTLGWRLKGIDAKPDKYRVHRTLDRLTKIKLVAKEGNAYRLTAAGSRRAGTSSTRGEVFQ